MPKNVTFYFSVLSPWVYLSGPRFHRIVQAAGATVDYRPIDLLKLFRDTGGTPLGQLHPSRQAYRAQDRARWSELLGMPLSDKPKFHPADETLAARMLIALDRQQRRDALWPLAQAMLAGVWVRDLDIAEPATLVMLANEAGLDGAALMAQAQDPSTLAPFEANTAEAMAVGVFGVPSFVLGTDIYFGQDRLDFVERALRS